MKYSIIPEIIGEPLLKLDGEISFSKKEKREAWENSIALNQIDGEYKPSDLLLELIDKEINGEIEIDTIVNLLVQKYTVKNSSEEK